MDDQFEDLMKLHLSLQKNKFYGTIIEVWQDGKVVTLRKEQVFKGKDFSQVVIEEISK